MTSTALLNTTVQATFVSHQRSQRRLHPRYALLEINNVHNREAAQNYMNNAVYISWTNKNGETFENYGVIRKHHGNKGAVRAIFERNLDPKAVGQTVYVKLYKVDNLSF
ncbi:large subunit ribosomal protein L35Ae [Pancytospora epiphaga]|nr:large subunit ribosomal protein L35Ae [Pancytospora epiphaga]